MLPYPKSECFIDRQYWDSQYWLTAWKYKPDTWVKFVPHEKLLLLLFMTGLCTIYVYCEFAFKECCFGKKKKSQLLLLHTFPKKAMICRQTAVPTSLRAGGSHLIQSHQKSVALGTCHSFEAEWEMMTLSQKWEGRGRRWDALHIKVGVFHVQRVGPNFQEAPAPAPSKTYQVAGWLLLFFFFKYKWNRFTCHVTWDNLCVSVCFSS